MASNHQKPVILLTTDPTDQRAVYLAGSLRRDNSLSLITQPISSDDQIAGCVGLIVLVLSQESLADTIWAQIQQALQCRRSVLILDTLFHDPIATFAADNPDFVSYESQVDLGLYAKCLWFLRQKSPTV